MAPKTETKTEEDTALEAFANSPNDFSSVLSEFGITADSLHVPKAPPTTLKQNLDQLCTLTSPIKDEHGNLITCEKHSGPMVFLRKQDEYDGDKFEGYDGFYVYMLLHPQKGKMAVTIGRPTGEQKPAVIAYWDSLKPGAYVQVAMMRTSNNFRLFQPVPVQQASEN